MTLSEYLRLIRERWGMIVAGLLVGFVIASLISVLSVPQYSAKATIYVSAQAPADTATAAYEGSLLSAQRIKSYIELLKGQRISQEVVRDLNLGITPDELTKRITAFAEPDTVLLTATVVDSSPDRAAQIANAVVASFTRVVAELEQSPAPPRPPAVAARVVQPATPPTSSISFPPAIVLTIGALLGLLAGFGAAYVVHRLDTSVKSAEDLRKLLDVPGLGDIAYDREVPDRPLTVYQEPHSPRAEAFRTLRTNLQFVDVDGARRVFVITSSVPSEGKTTTLCNLAIALADGGSRVLVIEADLRRPAAADYFHIDRAIGLTNALTGRVAVERAVKPWRSGGLDVLPSGPIPPNPSELLASQQMALLLDQLRSKYDYILLDTPPLNLVTDAAAVAPRTDGVVLVCRHGKTSRNQILQSARSIEAVGVPLLGTVLSMSPKGATPKSYDAYYSYYTGVTTLERQAPVRPGDAGNRAAPRPPAPDMQAPTGMDNGGASSWPPSPSPRPNGEPAAAGQGWPSPRQSIPPSGQGNDLSR